MNDEEAITIICPECETKYPLSMDTLRMSLSVRIVCKDCAETQLVRINSRDEIEIVPNPIAWEQ
jgi:RNase P subunit RPR2